MLFNSNLIQAYFVCNYRLYYTRVALENTIKVSKKTFETFPLIAQCCFVNKSNVINKYSYNFKFIIVKTICHSSLQDTKITKYVI